MPDIPGPSYTPIRWSDVQCPVHEGKPWRFLDFILVKTVSTYLWSRRMLCQVVEWFVKSLNGVTSIYVLSSFQMSRFWFTTIFLLNSYTQIKNMSDGRDGAKKQVVKSKPILRTFSSVSVPKKICMMMQIFVKISKQQSIANFKLLSSRHTL